jgi:hypothetical protein
MEIIMTLYKYPLLDGLWMKYQGLMDGTISSKYGICFMPYYPEHRHFNKIISTQHGKYKERDFIPVGLYQYND